MYVQLICDHRLQNLPSRKQDMLTSSVLVQILWSPPSFSSNFLLCRWSCHKAPRQYFICKRHYLHCCGINFCFEPYVLIHLYLWRGFILTYLLYCPWQSTNISHKKFRKWRNWAFSCTPTSTNRVLAFLREKVVSSRKRVVAVITRYKIKNAQSSSMICSYSII